MIVLIVPLFLPVMESISFSKVWLWVIATLYIGAGLLIPIVGVNLFILHEVAGESLENVMDGSWPFVALIILLSVIIYIWPPVATWFLA